MAHPVEATVSKPAQPETSRKHCWECLRRRLVCDSVRPVCDRCRIHGLVCPGYDEKQPLRWVQPGRVTAHTRRRPNAGSSARTKKRKSDNTDVKNADVTDRSLVTDGKCSSEDRLWKEFHTLYLLGQKQPRTLDAIMRYDITSENFAGVQASYIYNCGIYERSSPLPLLHEGPQAALPLAKIAQSLPAHIQGLFILLALGHQILQLPRDVDKSVRTRAWSAVSFWTFQVVHKLNEEIAHEKTQASDITITAVVMLMMIDQQLKPSSNWRFHYRGLMQMLMIRGGARKIWLEYPHMHNALMSMVMGEIFANTTSPSHDQVTELSHPKNFGFLPAILGSVGEAGNIYVGSICPPPLLYNLITINHLRALATQGIDNVPSPSSQLPPLSSASSSSSSSSLASTLPSISVNRDAQTLLGQILSFSPELYAATNGNARTQSKWLLVGRIHQSAVVLYCILSLQHVLLLPDTAALSRTTQTHYSRLLVDLKEGYKHERFKNCLFWPLIVAGVGAVNGTAFEKAFIADIIKDCAGDVGSSVPLMARNLLMSFWSSGKKGWDDCFEQPFILLV
ncbi:hypothetical protein F5B22DRAFT_598037 [Xylaria bambusicola]|uniref:uncharacterized protein n=1 Tax=Xylaria bambusicola TaxID=326684 RepID=UPI0020077F4B|nr:uncharacterized protein F5B22DRAFT_598037 [Xylaria bambusicola]KAI0520702.1 hypothetical protein F5B22DRAFT_598037 [Xylaria bambusicola]